MKTLNTIIQGKFKTWQILSFLAVNVQIFCFAFHALSMPFYAPHFNYVCNPTEEWMNSTAEVRREFEHTITKEQCRVTLEVFDNSTNVSTTYVQEKCLSWEYDTKEWKRTIISDFDLVCDRFYIIGISSSAHMSGMLFGVFMVSTIADRFGRKPVILVTMIIWFIGHFVLAFSPNITGFTIIRFIFAFVSTATMTCSVVYSIENFSERRRALLGNIQFTGFSIGTMFLTMMYYFMRDWFKVQLITSVFLGLDILLYAYLPESPIWLVTVKRNNQAKEAIKKIAKMNRIEIPDDATLDKELEESENIVPDQAKKTRNSILDLFKTPELRAITLASLSIWFVVSFSYYGFLLDTGSLYGGLFTNMTISSCLEILSVYISACMMVKFGRRSLTIGYLFSAGILLLISLAVPQNNEATRWTKTGIILIGRTLIFMVFLVLFTHCCEYFPTSTRTGGLGMVSAAARIGGMLSPFIVSLERTAGKDAILIIYGVLSAFVGLVAFRLPETKHCELQESAIDAENYWRARRPRLFKRKKADTRVT